MEKEGQRAHHREGIMNEKMRELQKTTGYLNELPAYAWPGGYPLVYTGGQNEFLCAACAQRALDNPDGWDEWLPDDYFIHYEGPPIFCSECNAEIESAYGDPYA